MLRVLVIERDPAVREALTRFLSSAGYTAVSSVPSLADGVATLLAKPIELVVCSEHGEERVEGGGDGVTAWARIRARGGTLGAVPIVALAAPGTGRAPLPGVIVLEKPVRLPDLLVAAHEVMRRGIA